MKKLSVAAAALAFASVAIAGEYHTTASLVCSDCHTMHASRSHGFGTAAADTSGVGVPADSAAAGHDYLLIQASINATCFQCHDGVNTGAPGVLAAAAGGATVAGTVPGTVGDRSAGFLNLSTDAATYTGHTMGGLATPPGWNGNTVVGDEWNVAAFSCTDCHTPHGSANFRNLVNAYGRVNTGFTGAVTYTKNTVFNTGRDVNIMVATNSYRATDVAYGNGSVASPALNQFCAKCHGNFHAGSTGLKHPTDGATLSAAAHNGNVAWGVQYALVRPLIAANAPGSAAPDAMNGSTVGCMTCHKSHGSANSFALIFPNFTDAATQGGTGTFAASTNMISGDGTGVRSLCVSCHSMGKRFYAAQ